MSKIHFCVVLGGVLFATVGYTAKQSNEGSAPVAVAAAAPALALSVGSGVEYHFSSVSHQLDMTYAIVNVGREGGGYWLEHRTCINLKSTSTRLLTKTLMVGNPPQPTRTIVQAAGLKPMEIRPQKRSSSAGLLFLEALAGGLELFQSEVANRQIQQAANARSHTNAEVLQYTGRQSTEIQLPAQPISPPNSGANGGVSRAEDSVHSPASSGTSDGALNTSPAAKAEKVGTEAITVPAGTFECDHYTRDSNGKHTDIWLSIRVPSLIDDQASSDLPRYGMVKATSADFSMELTKLLENQTSDIADKAKGR